MRLVASFEKHHPMGRSKEHWSAEVMLDVRGGKGQLGMMETANYLAPTTWVAGVAAAAP
jgi:hypothetical protein